MKSDISPYQYLMEKIESIKHKNRFFIDPEFDKFIEDYTNEAFNVKTYSKNTILYRARIYNEKDRDYKYHNPPQEKFQGYDEKNSFVNLQCNNLSEGRNNPAYIPYLYVSEDKTTSIAEVKPYANTLVSVAKIKVLENLKVVNFAQKGCEAKDTWCSSLYLLINNLYNAPSFENGDYLLCQYISEKIKSLGFDGVRFRSAFTIITDSSPSYYNLTIFNYDKCKAISSELHNIDKVTVKHKPV